MPLSDGNGLGYGPVNLKPRNTATDYADYEVASGKVAAANERNNRINQPKKDAGLWTRSYADYASSDQNYNALTYLNTTNPQSARMVLDGTQMMMEHDKNMSDRIYQLEKDINDKPEIYGTIENQRYVSMYTDLGLGASYSHPSYDGSSKFYKVYSPEKAYELSQKYPELADKFEKDPMFEGYLSLSSDDMAVNPSAYRVGTKGDVNKRRAADVSELKKEDIVKRRETLMKDEDLKLYYTVQSNTDGTRSFVSKDRIGKRAFRSMLKLSYKDAYVSNDGTLEDDPVVAGFKAKNLDLTPEGLAWYENSDMATWTSEGEADEPIAWSSRSVAEKWMLADRIVGEYGIDLANSIGDGKVVDQKVSKGTPRKDDGSGTPKDEDLVYPYKIVDEATKEAKPQKTIKVNYGSLEGSAKSRSKADPKTTTRETLVDMDIAGTLAFGTKIQAPDTRQNTTQKTPIDVYGIAMDADGNFYGMVAENPDIAAAAINANANKGVMSTLQPNQSWIYMTESTANNVAAKMNEGGRAFKMSDGTVIKITNLDDLIKVMKDQSFVGEF